MDDSEFTKLARYNAEVARGLVHTEAWRAEMAEEQRRFDYYQAERLAASTTPRRTKWWQR